MPSGDAGWPSYRYLVGAAAGILLVVGVARFLSALVQPLLLVAVAVLLSVLVHLPIARLTRWMPRPIATLVTLLLFLTSAAGIGLWLLPQLYRQAAVLLDELPAVVRAVTGWWERTQQRAPLADIPGERLPESVEQRLLEELGGWISGALPLAFDAVIATIAAFFVLGVAFFLAHRPTLYLEGILRVVPAAWEGRVAAFLHRLVGVIRHWLLGALVSMTFVGLVTGLATWLLGLEAWLLLGVLAFALEVIPYAGPILAAAPAVALALGQSPTLAIWTALVYLAIQQIEGNAVTPIVMKRAIELPPALLLVWQVALATTLGPLGLFVGAPLLAALLVAVDHFWVRGVLDKA